MIDAVTLNVFSSAPPPPTSLSSQSSWSELDTGYVSADSSPTTIHFTTVSGRVLHVIVCAIDLESSPLSSLLFSSLPPQDGLEVPVFFTDPIVTTPSHVHHHHHHPPPPPYVFNPPMFQPELYSLVQLGHHPPVAATHPQRLHLQPLHQ